MRIGPSAGAVIRISGFLIKEMDEISQMVKH